MPVAAEITDTYAGYFAAFQRLDPAAVAPYFHLPCVMVTAGAVTVATTADEVTRLFDGMMTRLRGIGYASTDLLDRRVRVLGAGLAQLTISAVRRRADGAELERIGATYLYRRADGWKVAMIAVHDPDV
jgi:ketosteroid isomerase-like protein